MKKKLMSVLFATVACLAPVGAVEWQTDWTAAKQQAAEENKPLFLFFTGSNWCSWCNRLESEVLSTPEFTSRMGDKFIFVKLDFPRGESQSETLKKQNKVLQDTYEVSSYPTVILVNSQGEVINSTGYRSGGAAAYADHLEGMLK